MMGWTAGSCAAAKALDVSGHDSHRADFFAAVVGTETLVEGQPLLGICRWASARGR